MDVLHGHNFSRSYPSKMTNPLYLDRASVLPLRWLRHRWLLLPRWHVLLSGISRGPPHILNCCQNSSGLSHFTAHSPTPALPVRHLVWQQKSIKNNHGCFSSHTSLHVVKLMKTISTDHGIAARLHSDPIISHISNASGPLLHEKGWTSSKPYKHTDHTWKPVLSFYFNLASNGTSFSAGNFRASFSG